MLDLEKRIHDLEHQKVKSAEMVTRLVTKRQNAKKHNRELLTLYLKAQTRIKELERELCEARAMEAA